jgi:CHAT domain-containing protein
MLKNCLATIQEIQSLKELNSSEPSSQCPSEEMWLKVVAGIVDEVEATKLLQHAAECRTCAAFLERATVYFADEPVRFPGLKSRDPEWQRNIAEQMAFNTRKKPRVLNLLAVVQEYLSRAVREPRQLDSQLRISGAFSQRQPKPFNKRRFWLLIPSSISALALVVVVLLFWPRPKSVEQLLGQAYAQNRTLEPRFFGALYGQVRTERSGKGQSLLSESPALLEALPIISRNVHEQPNNPRWLDAKGRADLLGGNYDAAIQSFQRALEVEPDSAFLETDLASAYFERAQIMDRPQDYGKAIEFLGRALSKKPDDPIALYNRALVSEKMFLFHQAVDDWTRYLQIDATGEWAKEAKSHLDAIRQKLREQDRSNAEPLLTPEAFILQQRSGDERLMRHLDEKAEDYLDQAVREWLPAAFPAASARTNGDARRKDAEVQSARLALDALSEMLRAEHKDLWLSDLLATHNSNLMASAVIALKEAAAANARGNFQLANIKAARAVQLFRRSAKGAGEFRARYEVVYALHQTQLGRRCLAVAIPLAKRLPPGRYPWIQAQLDLELSSCWEQIGYFDESGRCVARALIQSEKSGYRVLYLRALGIAATLQSDRGNEATAYSIDQKGLARYWSGSYPPMRAYLFYSDLGFPAQESGRWHLALALQREAVSAITLTEQHLGTALAHHRLARVASAVGDHALAKAEFERANRLFAALPQTDATRTYQASGEIDLAKLGVERGTTEEASSHLASARALLPRIVDRFTALDFYQTVGLLEQERGNYKEAEQASRSAVSLAEWSLASLKTDRERSTWARETNQSYRALAELRWRAGDIQGALGIWESYRGAAVRKAQMPASAANLAVARLNLSDLLFDRVENGPRYTQDKQPFEDISTLHDATVLSYMQLSKGLVVWAFDDRGTIARWIPELPQDMMIRSRHFRDECADPGSDLATLRKDARQLYDLLIGPISNRLSAQRLLVIEADDTMADIPMQALVDVDGEYLGEHHSVMFSPGMLYWRHLGTVENFSSRQRALTVGSPALIGDPAGSLTPLEDAVQEARYVASQFDKPVLLTGAQATLPKVLEALRGAVIFHFAGHSKSGVEGTSLLLANSNTASVQGQTTPNLDSSRLAPSDLRRLRLVVLSACSTAKEDDDSPGSPENLAAAFLRSGVPHVVASRWNVSSRATLELMRSFYSSLLDNEPVSESLRIAARELRKRPDTAHPYYWAAFAAFGR